MVLVTLTGGLLLCLNTEGENVGVPSATSDVGAAGLRATAIAGGVGGVLDPPPQAVSQAARAASAKRGTARREVIVCLRCLRYAPCRKQRRWRTNCGPGIRWRCGSSPDGPQH